MNEESIKVYKEMVKAVTEDYINYKKQIDKIKKVLEPYKIKWKRGKEVLPLVTFDDCIKTLRIIQIIVGE